MRLDVRGIFLIAFLALAAGCGNGEKLTCSYSKADISTLDSEHVVLAGFAARKKLSDGIHQHIYSHCLTFKDKSGQKVCIISNDLMEISPALTDSIRTLIADKSGLAFDRILVHNIHTHSAPRSGGSSNFTGGTNRAWKDRMVEAMVSNAVNTISEEAAFRPFSLEVAKGTTSINGNRCEKTGPVDHDVYVARFKRRGKPFVSIVNVACHPVCMGPGSLMLSSDYPGICGSILSKAWGGDVFQLTGAAGNMDPAKGPKKVEYAQECGESLARSLIGLKFTKVPSRGFLSLVNETVDLPYRIDSVTPAAVMHHADSLAATASSVSPTFAEDVRGWEKEILDRFKNGTVSSKLRYHLHVADVNGVLFFFSDGEPFCEYQMNTRKAFPGKTIFFAGYTDGQNSYLPSARAFEVRKGYEYETEQMHVYIKAPYPLSDKVPEVYQKGVIKIIDDAIKTESSR